MSPVARLRASPSAWLAVVLVALAMAHVGTTLRWVDPYVLDVTAKGLEPVFLVGPVAAAFAAWEAARTSRLVATVGSARRSTAAIVADALWAPWLAGALALTATLTFVSMSRDVAPDPGMVVLALLTLTAHALLGHGVGRVVRPVFAVPALLVGLYLWMVFPPAIEPLWLRHLTGTFSGCCQVQHVLAPGVVAGIGATAAGLAVAGALCSLRGPRTILRSILAVVAVLAGMVFGASAVDHLGPSPGAPRPATDLVCDRSRVEVCVWPEHVHRMPDLLAAADEVVEMLTGVGLSPPEGFTEGLGDDRIAGYGISVRTQPERFSEILARSSAQVVSLSCEESGVRSDIAADVLVGLLGEAAREEMASRDDWLARAASVIAGELSAGARTSSESGVTCSIDG